MISCQIQRTHFLRSRNAWNQVTVAVIMIRWIRNNIQLQFLHKGYVRSWCFMNETLLCRHNCVCHDGYNIIAVKLHVSSIVEWVPGTHCKNNNIQLAGSGVMVTPLPAVNIMLEIASYVCMTVFMFCIIIYWVVCTCTHDACMTTRGFTGCPVKTYRFIHVAILRIGKVVPW